MDLMGKNGSSWGVQRWPPQKNGKGFFFFGLMMVGWCSPIFFNEVCWGTIYTPEKKGNERQEPEIDGFRNFGDCFVNYEDCLVSMFVLEGVHTYYVQSPLLKGVAKNHICSPAKPSSWSEVPSKGMLYILSQYNLDGKRFILQLKKVCFDMMCDDVEMQHNLLECTTLTFYFCIFYDSTGWNLLIKHSLF